MALFPGKKSGYPTHIQYTADSSDTFHRKNRQEGGELEAEGKTQEKCTGEEKY
jgi:hypothetical protein